jgi:hypothetical protein
MAEIKVDAALANQLQNTHKVTVVRDDGGRLIGYFASVAVADQVPIIKAAALFDPAETKRLIAENTGKPGYSFEQVKAYLAKLEANPELQKRHQAQRSEAN